MRSRGTHACTIAEIKNPNANAHHTSHAINNASRTPCQRTSKTALTDVVP
jgi:hypothetical protein